MQPYTTDQANTQEPSQPGRKQNLSEELEAVSLVHLAVHSQWARVKLMGALMQ